MTSGVLADLLLREPFQPFHIVLGDHTDIHVDRPSQARHETGNRMPRCDRVGRPPGVHH